MENCEPGCFNSPSVLFFGTLGTLLLLRRHCQKKGFDWCCWCLVSMRSRRTKEWVIHWCDHYRGNCCCLQQEHFTVFKKHNLHTKYYHLSLSFHLHAESMTICAFIDGYVLPHASSQFLTSERLQMKPSKIIEKTFEKAKLKCHQCTVATVKSISDSRPKTASISSSRIIAQLRAF
jgi:hypothetical protein